VEDNRNISLLKYFFAGFQLNLTACVDFTISNGDPEEETSLHYTGD